MDEPLVFAPEGRPARRHVVARLRMAALAATAATLSGAVLAQAAAHVNPLDAHIPSSGARVESCADPTVIRSQEPGDDAYYMFCTSDPLNGQDRDAYGNFNYHLIPILRSSDLLHWDYVGDVFSARPSWVEPGSYLWAPEIQRFNNKYFLYYAATDSKASVSGEPMCGSDSAIGVATASSLPGPWTDKGSPVVAPRRAGQGCDFYATIDPEAILAADNRKYIYYGSFYGGIEVRDLSSNGLNTSPSTAVRVVIPDRAEAPLVLQRDGFCYLLVSTSDCCNGPLSGYAVVAGRSTSPTGPFTDHEGVPLDAGRAGGTPVLYQTGDRWIGPGHNTALTDTAGQDWTIYHAIDASDPYFSGSVGFTKRPVLLDPLDWVDGWPTVRGGWWVSHCSQPVPAAQPGDPAPYQPTRRDDDAPAAPLADFSDEFSGGALDPRWSWVRPPGAGSYGVGGGALRFDTQAADLYEDDNSASILTEAAPTGEFLVETRVSSSVPPDGCCYNYRQAGLLIYGDDDNYIKLTCAAIWGTRQTEFAAERAHVQSGFPRYGKSFIGPPADWTHLRIVRRLYGAEELYTAYTSRDGSAWSRGGTWAHSLGAAPRIGLVSMGGAGYTASFDYVRVYTLAAPPCSDPARADPCDGDGDGTGDFCDTDDDGDGLADAPDCAPLDPAQGTPGEVAPLTLSGSPTATLSWPAAARADVYDVSRALTSSLSPGDYGTCLWDDLAQTSTTDGGLPPAGDSFLYLVRGEDQGCGGAGTYGAGSDLAERVNANPAACP